MLAGYKAISLVYYKINSVNGERLLLHFFLLISLSLFHSLYNLTVEKLLSLLHYLEESLKVLVDNVSFDNCVFESFLL